MIMDGGLVCLILFEYELASFIPSIFLKKHEVLSGKIFFVAGMERINAQNVRFTRSFVG